MRTVEIAHRLTCCAGILDATDQHLQLTLFRLLARGEPVEAGRLADHVGLETATVVARLGRWHGVHLDAEGRAVAFQGLSLAQTPHRVRVEGRTLYAWCAWDTLFLPELIGRPAAIESTCPETERTVSLRVGPSGPTEVAPPEAALSLLLPRSQRCDDTIKSFCSLIQFLATRHAAEAWTARHPGTFVTSIEDGFQIGRRTNAAQFGDALSNLDEPPA